MINNKVIMAIFISGIAGLSTILGSFVIFLKMPPKKVNHFVAFCLSFSLTVMIGISLFDLIPESFFYLLSNFSKIKGLILSIISFLGGVGVIAYISKKIEDKSNNSLYRLGILNMVALMLHNLPEGIATFMSSYNNINIGIKLSFAIMLHNIPEGISIAVPIYYATNSKRKAITRTLISGLAEPLGAILTYLFLVPYISDALISIILIIVAGIMISLAINKLLPESLKYDKGDSMKVGLLAGIIINLVNYILF